MKKWKGTKIWYGMKVPKKWGFWRKRRFKKRLNKGGMI